MCWFTYSKSNLVLIPGGVRKSIISLLNYSKVLLCILNEELPCDWLKDEQQVDEQLIGGCHLVAVQCNIYSKEFNAGLVRF